MGSVDLVPCRPSRPNRPTVNPAAIRGQESRTVRTPGCCSNRANRLRWRPSYGGAANALAGLR